MLAIAMRFWLEPIEASIGPDQKQPSIASIVRTFRDGDDHERSQLKEKGLWVP